MKVSELIQYLERMPQDAEIVTLSKSSGGRWEQQTTNGFPEYLEKDHHMNEIQTTDIVIIY